MIFSSLSKKIQDGIRTLATDEQFQKRFSQDKILDQLDEQKINYDDEIQIHQILTENKISLLNRDFNPITPRIWNFLWCLKSPFINGGREITSLDIDIIIYLLTIPLQNLYNPKEILQNTPGYCSKINLGYDQAIKVIQLIIKLSFKPLNLFPKANIETGTEMIYDGDWVLSTISRVHSVTGLLPKDIMNLSMTAICYYFADFKRLNGAENIFRHSPEQILIQQDQRCCELICQRLIEKGYITEQQKEQVYSKMIIRPK